MAAFASHFVEDLGPLAAVAPVMGQTAFSMPAGIGCGAADLEFPVAIELDRDPREEDLLRRLLKNPMAN